MSNFLNGILPNPYPIGIPMGLGDHWAPNGGRPLGDFNDDSHSHHLKNGPNFPTIPVTHLNPPLE